MTDVCLLLPASTYRAGAFLAAARKLGIGARVATDAASELPAIAARRVIEVDFDDAEAAAGALERAHREGAFRAFVGVDDRSALAAALATARTGVGRAHPPGAIAATRDKARLRELLTAAGMPQPAFAVVAPPYDADRMLAQAPGFPCVVKPAGLQGSRGVIRADGPAQLAAALRRAGAIQGASGDAHRPLVVEEYLEGHEIAVDALAVAGELRLLAAFDKPEPLTGPFFEETIYLRPAFGGPAPGEEEVVESLAAACTALALTGGPVHAEARIVGDGRQARIVWIDIGARLIGGHCSAAAVLSGGVSLEEVVLAHACGLPLPPIAPAPGASGVLMLPIPATGTLTAVRGLDAARTLAHVTGVEITIPVGRPITALPEGDRYLGFAFAEAPERDAVLAALQQVAATVIPEIAPGTAGGTAAGAPT